MHRSAYLRAADRPRAFLRRAKKRGHGEDRQRKANLTQVDKKKIEYPASVPP